MAKCTLSHNVRFDFRDSLKILDGANIWRKLVEQNYFDIIQCEGEQVYIDWLDVCTEDITDDYWVLCFVRGTMQHLQSYTCFNMQ